MVRDHLILYFIYLLGHFFSLSIGFGMKLNMVSEENISRLGALVCVS